MFVGRERDPYIARYAERKNVFRTVGGAQWVAMQELLIDRKTVAHVPIHYIAMRQGINACFLP